MDEIVSVARSRRVLTTGTRADVLSRICGSMDPVPVPAVVAAVRAGAAAQTAELWSRKFAAKIAQMEEAKVKKVPTPVKINCEIAAIFNQVSTICWFHTAAVLLFFADGIRDHVWAKSFQLELTDTGVMIPRALVRRDWDTSTAIVLEIIRQEIEIAAETWAGKISTGRKSIPRRFADRVGKRISAVPMLALSRQTSVDICDMTLQAEICNMKRKWCGKRGGWPSKTAWSILNALGLPSDMYGVLKFSTPVGDTTAVVLEVIATFGAHGLAVIRCNGEWFMFDNNSRSVKTVPLTGKIVTFDDIIAEVKSLEPKISEIQAVHYIESFPRSTPVPKIQLTVEGKTEYKLLNFLDAFPTPDDDAAAAAFIYNRETIHYIFDDIDGSIKLETHAIIGARPTYGELMRRDDFPGGPVVKPVEVAYINGQHRVFADYLVEQKNGEECTIELNYDDDATDTRFWVVKY